MAGLASLSAAGISPNAATQNHGWKKLVFPVRLVELERSLRNAPKKAGSFTAVRVIRNAILRPGINQPERPAQIAGECWLKKRTSQLSATIATPVSLRKNKKAKSSIGTKRAPTKAISIMLRGAGYGKLYRYHQRKT